LFNIRRKMNHWNYAPHCLSTEETCTRYVLYAV